jgi:hypothetical protein
MLKVESARDSRLALSNPYIYSIAIYCVTQQRGLSLLIADAIGCGHPNFFLGFGGIFLLLLQVGFHT